jgi:predicted DNA-binding antitoxin AbrB/MazE fold protein
MAAAIMLGTGRRYNQHSEVMTITVTAVYEGGGVLKLERPLAIKEKAKVNVTIEAAPEVTVAADGDDPTGWKAAEEFIGMWKNAPRLSSGAASEEHDRILYGHR